MRFGFAGVGHPHANSWSQAVSDNGGEIVAIHDPSREKAAAHAARAGGAVVERVEDLGDHRLDAVVVDGRCDEVAALALAVLEQNLPILMEKPGGMTAAELARIEAIARDRGLASQMGYFLRYADSLAEVKTAINDDSLGKITLARCHAAMPHRAWDVMGPWFADPTNITSIFQEDACHVVDIMIDLLGAPKGVVAQRITGQFEPSVSEDAIATIWDYGTHLATIDFTAHEANPWIDAWSVEIYGSIGTIRAGMAPEWRERYTATTGWQASGETRLTGPSDGHARDASSREHYRRAMAGLIAAIEGGLPAPANLSIGLQVFRAVEAIARAADTGARVEL